MTMDAAGDVASFLYRPDDERTSIRGADLAGDEFSLDEPVENAGQRGSLVRQSAVELRDAGRRGFREVRQDVRLALRQAERAQIGEVEADPVRRP